MVIHLHVLKYLRTYVNCIFQKRLYWRAQRGLLWGAPIPQGSHLWKNGKSSPKEVACTSDRRQPLGFSLHSVNFRSNVLNIVQRRWLKRCIQGLPQVAGWSTRWGLFWGSYQNPQKVLCVEKREKACLCVHSTTYWVFSDFFEKKLTEEDRRETLSSLDVG